MYGFLQTLQRWSADERHRRWTVFGILALAVVLRVALVVLAERGWHQDSIIYLNLAKRILNGNPMGFFPNGYPLIIAAVMKVAGPPSAPLLALNVLMSVGAVALTYYVGRSVGGWATGALAALVLSVYPNQLVYVRMLLTEPIAAGLLLAGIALLLRPKPGRAFAAGLLLAYASLVRMTLLPVLPLFALVLAGGYRSGRSAGALLAGAALIWAGHTALLSAGIIEPADNFEYNVFVSSISMSSQGIDFPTDFDPLFTAEEQESALRTYVTRGVSDPGRFLLQRASSLWELWGPWPGPGDPEHPRRWWAKVILGLRFVFFVPALWALWRYRRNPQAWLLGIPVAVITLIHTAFFSLSRFSYVAEPLVIVLAAWVLTDTLRGPATPDTAATPAHAAARR